jgi:hypothetical protein
LRRNTLSSYGFLRTRGCDVSSILNSDRAILVNIRIIRIFVKVREILQSNKEIILKLDEIEQKIAGHDDKILLIFEYLRQLEQARQQQDEQIGRKKIGYRQEK